MNGTGTICTCTISYKSTEIKKSPNEMGMLRIAVLQCDEERLNHLCHHRHSGRGPR